jgi:hypothetical protein
MKANSRVVVVVFTTLLVTEVVSISPPRLARICLVAIVASPLFALLLISEPRSLTVDNSLWKYL